MVLQVMYWKGDALLKYDRHAAKYTNEKKISHISKTYFRTAPDLFSDKTFSFATNDHSTPEEFSKFMDNESACHLNLHTNTSSLSYNIDDLASFLLNSRKRPRIIGISECHLKAN